MEKPFIDTRNITKLNAANIMLKHPHSYFSNQKNVTRLKEVFKEEHAVLRLIDLLHDTQKNFSEFITKSDNYLDGFCKINNVIQEKTDSYVSIRNIVSSTTPPELVDSIKDQLIADLNINLAETLNGYQIKTETLTDAAYIIEKILSSSWIVKHFALMTVGVLQLNECDDGSLEFSPTSQESFRGIWFGSALERSSVESDYIAIRAFAEFLNCGDGNRQTYYDLQTRVQMIVAKHWRIGADGLFSDLFHEIQDLFIILITIIQKHLLQEIPDPLKEDEIKKMMLKAESLGGLHETYEIIKNFQMSMSSDNRLFEIEHNGLVLGSLDIVRGLIKQIEFFAKEKIGKDWHSNLEDQQKDYILSKLRCASHIEILNFELKPEHFDASSTPNLRLDVDFFLRDSIHEVIYAVQMKHVELINESGLAAWFKLIGVHDSKINKGILQLQRLKEVISSNESAREYLIKKGLTHKELKNIIPVIIHNSGCLDFFHLQEGLWLYDQITFTKALTGRSSIVDLYNDGHYSSNKVHRKSNEHLRIDDPASIIEAYISDKNFSHLRYFDAPKYLTRETILNGVKIKSIGVGI